MESTRIVPQRKAHDISEFKHAIDLSSAHAFGAKFSAQGRITPQGKKIVFRNKNIVFVFIYK